MKNKYIAPSLEVEETEITVIMAESGIDVDIDVGDGLD